MDRKSSIVSIFILALTLLTLAACGTQTATPTPLAPDAALLMGTPVATTDQATLVAALTQEKNNSDNQSATTAEIVRANAVATFNSANATLSAAQSRPKTAPILSQPKSQPPPRLRAPMHRRL